MINRYSLTLGSRVIAFSPKELSFEIRLKDTVWRWGAAPSITLSDGDILLFSEARCECAPRRTGVSDGVAAQYSAFRGKSGKAYEIKAYTFTWVNASTGELNFDIRVEGDKEGQITALSYPAASRSGSLFRTVLLTGISGGSAPFSMTEPRSRLILTEVSGKSAPTASPLRAARKRVGV